jgi:hypothetical protein
MCEWDFDKFLRIFDSIKYQIPTLKICIEKPPRIARAVLENSKFS